MMDQITLNRIKLIHPLLRKEVLEIYKYISENFMSRNTQLRLTNTYRSFSEQDELYKIGRTINFDAKGKKLKKITNAKSGQSMHNYGLAFDIVFLIDTDNNGTFETINWDTSADFNKNKLADWLEVVNCFKNLGWSWGGDWKSFKDYPHLEKTFGYTWQQLLQKYKSGDTFTELINNKTYTWVKL